MYWAFDGFFDLNTEVNFRLKEVLELVEKTEEEEEEEEGLESEGITVGRSEERRVGKECLE